MNAISVCTCVLDSVFGAELMISKQFPSVQWAADRPLPGSYLVSLGVYRKQII